MMLPVGPQGGFLDLAARGLWLSTSRGPMFLTCQARQAQNGLRAQLREWRARAHAAERRALEERVRRQGLEENTKSALAEVRRVLDGELGGRV